MFRASSVFILITIATFGALNVLFPNATLNLLLALAVGIITAWADDSLLSPAEEEVEDK